MAFDPDLQRFYDRIRLIPGAGDPREGQLCIMSLAAHLAGEPHSDAPSTTSPLIREFAIALNDATTADVRQRLKPFAPGVLGTKDACDDARAGLLFDAVQREILPAVREDLVAGLLRRDRPDGAREAGAGETTPDLRRDAAEIGRATHHLLSVTLLNLERAQRRRRHPVLARRSVRLLAVAARAAPTPDRRRRHWLAGIDLLDRMCHVGPPPLRRSARPSRIRLSPPNRTPGDGAPPLRPER